MDIEKRIIKSANIVINFIDEIIKNNEEKQFINETEFEFGDKYDVYNEQKFKEIIDEHYKDKNVTYSMKEKCNHVAIFKFTLHDWIK